MLSADSQLGTVGYLYGVTGRPAEARKVLADVDQLAQKRYCPCWAQGIVYLGLGQNSVALDWLEKAYEERETYMVALKVDPLLVPLRNEPRFQAL